MAEHFRVLDYLSLAVPGVGSNLIGDIFSICLLCSLSVPDSWEKPIQMKKKYDIGAQR